MTDKKLLTSLSKLGYPMFEPSEELDVNETLAEVVKSHDTRLWEGFPVLLANAAESYKFVPEQVKQQLTRKEQKDNFHRLMLLSGSWLAKGTGVADARLSGVHLRLPGYGETGPSLEIFQYAENAPKPAAAANREGFAHIAFAVDDVAAAVEDVLRHGGQKVGDIASFEVEDRGTMTFVYMADPEGNIIELQNLAAKPET